MELTAEILIITAGAAVFAVLAFAARKISALSQSVSRLTDRVDAARRETAAGLDALTGMAARTTAEEPVFPRDDAKMQAGIFNLMGYDPKDRKRGA